MCAGGGISALRPDTTVFAPALGVWKVPANGLVIVAAITLVQLYLVTVQREKCLMTSCSMLFPAQPRCILGNMDESTRKDLLPPRFGHFSTSLS